MSAKSDHREVYWLGQISHESMAPVFESIRDYLWDDAENPVTLCLSSEGGSLDAAIAFHDLIRHANNWSTKLHIHVVGEASSAALVVMMASDHRSASPNTLFVFHPVERFVYADTQLTIAHAREMCSVMARKQDIVQRIIAEAIQVHAYDPNAGERLADMLTKWMEERAVIDHQTAKISGIINEE